jgi:aminoglycoside 3-N-acetyltransferase
LSIKKTVKKHLYQSKRWWQTRRYPFSACELTEALILLGIKAGDLVLAHIAFNQFIGFTGRPSEVLDSLRTAVTPSGTLLMPSMPFTGSALEYIHSGRMLDVRRTPSAMGLVTELFRRSPGTLRSLHPTHPVLGSGPHAREMLRDHPLARTPCGRHSPYAKLEEANGKIALLGAGIGTLTFYHYLEETLEDLLPRSPFTQQAFDLRFLGYDGETVQVTNRLYDPDMSARRRLGKIEQELKKRGDWHERRLGRMSLVVLEARAVSKAVRAMAETGIYCYV